MADEFHSSTNWWDRSRFETGVEGSSSSSTSSSGLTSLGSFPWQAEIGDAKRRSSMESVSVSDGLGVDLNMMGLGPSSQAMDWSQTLIRGDKSENSFRPMLQENLSSSSNTYQQESGIRFSHVNWKEQINRGFSLDQPQFSPHGSSSDSSVTCQGLPTSFQIDSSTMYGSHPQVFQGLLGHENQPQHPSFDRQMDLIPYGGNYAIGSSDQLLPPWPKVPHFFRNSPPKQAPHHSQVHFSNNATFWNASASTIQDARPSFYPSLHPQFPTTNLEEKPKNITEVRDSNVIAKKSGSEISTKRPRNETASPLPPFKVKKEKMGDRITALQQLVSPFGKTDTASVLSEAIENIKFLHDQVNVLSTPYMKSGAPIHQQQGSGKPTDPEGSQKQDLRSRGLCLVPISSTFPVTHETTVDFWTPTFGGTFR